jgi:hypothetical protein
MVPTPQTRSKPQVKIELEVEQWEDISAAMENEYGRPTVSYSGRGMMGDRCIGVSFDRDSSGGIWSLATALAEIDIDLARDMGEPRQDSMGLGTIYYWPRVTAPEGTEEYDDEDEEW